MMWLNTGVFLKITKTRSTPVLQFHTQKTHSKHSPKRVFSFYCVLARFVHASNAGVEASFVRAEVFFFRGEMVS